MVNKFERWLTLILSLPARPATPLTKGGIEFPTLWI